MLISALYTLPDPRRMIIKRKDGLFYFAATPVRKLGEDDLTKVNTPLSEAQYLASIHADVCDGAIGAHQMRTFGLTNVPLTEARRAAGLTQAALSAASGVNVRQIRRVEIGESSAGNLTAKNILALADTLGVDPHDLI